MFFPQVKKAISYNNITCLLSAFMCLSAAVCFGRDPTRPYLDVDMKHVVIRQAPPGRYAMYGGLTRLPTGEIFCVFKVGSLDKKTGSPWTVRDETIVWMRSSDNGLTWPQKENLIYMDSATRQENCCGKGYLAGNGTLLHPFYVLNADYEERAKEDNWSKLKLASSSDCGKTWKIVDVQTPFAIAASFGGILRMRDGMLLLNAYGSSQRGSFRHEAGVLRSKNDGETWSDYSVIGQTADPDKGPARLNETDVVELADGRLLSMSRTQYDGYPLFRGLSADKGYSWTAERSGLTGLCPSLCYTTAGPEEGTVVVTYHDRWGKHAAKGGIYVAFSTDGGAIWGEPLWISSGAYPCMIELQKGTIFCSYYQSNVLLRGTLFKVPFPSGLRANIGSTRGERPCVRLKWDSYRGRNSKLYEYRVYRSLASDVQVTRDNLVGSCRETSIYDDVSTNAKGQCYYRVAAYHCNRQVGVSWAARVYAENTTTDE
ncbi:MAG: sialidase family protein [Kiritimatiellae bacterium]|nr:sialidase family protein [Kiritimatiellia bacterium]MDD5523296.1 sialidase family protein [Kiritimatiellia bacterium]